LFLEVEYDAKRDAKEQHEAKMKEVRKVEELRKEKEAESNKTNTKKPISMTIFRQCQGNR
jgi:hypothetical protein